MNSGSDALVLMIECFIPTHKAKNAATTHESLVYGERTFMRCASVRTREHRHFVFFPTLT